MRNEVTSLTTWDNNLSSWKRTVGSVGSYTVINSSGHNCLTGSNWNFSAFVI